MALCCETEACTTTVKSELWTLRAESQCILETLVMIMNPCPAHRMIADSGQHNGCELFLFMPGLMQCHLLGKSCLISSLNDDLMLKLLHGARVLSVTSLS